MKKWKNRNMIGLMFKDIVKLNKKMFKILKIKFIKKKGTINQIIPQTNHRIIIILNPWIKAIHIYKKRKLEIGNLA